MPGMTARAPAIRWRALICTAILGLLIVIARNAGVAGTPNMGAEIGLPPFNAGLSELRIWAQPEDDPTSYILRLSTKAGRVDGELIAISHGSPGLRVRRVTIARDWSAVLHDLERHSVWALPKPTDMVLCGSESSIVVETYRNDFYRRADVEGACVYADGRDSDNAYGTYAYVFALIAESTQIVSLSDATTLDC